MRKRITVLAVCLCITVLSSAGCGKNETKNESTDVANIEKSQSGITDNDSDRVRFHVSDWEEEDFLASSFYEEKTIKKEITVSDGKSYFALISKGNDTTIIPIPNGKGKIIDHVKDKEFPFSFEIGAIFEMESPNDNALEINLEDIENDIHEMESDYLRDSVTVSATVTAKSNSSFILFYQVVNSNSDIIDYGYRIIENGEGELWEFITFEFLYPY